MWFSILSKPVLLETEEEYSEPVDHFTYYGEEYPVWSTFTSSSRPENYEKGKFNRYAKLGQMAQDLEQQFQILISNSPNTKEARCAYACLLMMRYGIRIGNEGSAEGYVSAMKHNPGEIVQTYGMTTLQKDHVSFKNGVMLLNFLGKEQVSHSIIIKDRFLIKMGRYYHSNAENAWLRIGYSELFRFVRDQVGVAFIPKDFRTFCANTKAWRSIKKILAEPKREKKSEANKDVKRLVEIVAKRLGNTPGVAKRAYLDSRMVDWFKAQRLEVDEED